jgi:hypothetical protein
MSDYPASQKLWRISRSLDGFYYEIKLAGVVIDRLKIEEPTLTFLKQEGVISEVKEVK